MRKNLKARSHICQRPKEPTPSLLEFLWSCAKTENFSGTGEETSGATSPDPPPHSAKSKGSQRRGASDQLATKAAEADASYVGDIRMLADALHFGVAIGRYVVAAFEFLRKVVDPETDNRQRMKDIGYEENSRMARVWRRRQSETCIPRHSHLGQCA